MEDDDIQTLYQQLQLDVRKLANKLREYIRDHKDNLNQNNDELIRLAKLYIVLQYFAGTDIQQIDGNINQQKINEYKQELIDLV